jgi:hypothetical protein
MSRWSIAALACVLALASAVPVRAQGGGASSTGTIQGRVSDAQGAALPGVTVTATSPAMPGVQSTVSTESGTYRFPGVPPGVYTLTYELAGFNTLRREGVQITLGFTATLNVELTVATVQETVTVTGASPLIDATSTRVQQNFTLDNLQSIPNGRDMWSLLAVTPSVQMARIDVGGNRAGTQTGYQAYGFSGQVRVLIEGINTTEGTGGAGFYFDYSSLDEVFLGTSGQGAEMPNPGVQSQFIAKSGGNTFSGEAYYDWYNNLLQWSNLPDRYLAAQKDGGYGIRQGANEIDRYYDRAVNMGGPIVKDRIWWFGTYREQFNAVQQPQFQFDQTFDTKLWNPVGKATIQLNSRNKLIGYYQWGQKVQPNRLPYASDIYRSADTTLRQDSGSWVWKGEWNSTITDRLYFETRVGDFGYYFPLIANSDQAYFWRDTGAGELTGAQQKWQIDRDRKQVTTASTLFIDAGWGSHTLKVGGELLLEQGWEGYQQQYGGNVGHFSVNGVSSSIEIAPPTARAIGGLKNNDNGDLTSRAALDVWGAFLNDTWQVGRLTLNAGVRYDRYRGWLPEQQQLAFSHPLLQLPAAMFAERELYVWNRFAPRVGVTLDLTGDGKTLFKTNYGMFWHNPGVGVGSSANPNTAGKFRSYAWTDRNGDRVWQPGEEGAVTGQALAGAIQLDPAIKAPLTHEISTWLERELTGTMGIRAGFVYKTQADLIATYTPQRSLLNGAYSVVFPFTDIGADGRAGTADDQVITLRGLPRIYEANFPLTRVVQNVDQDENFKTVELAFTRRYSNKWSFQLGGAYTWLQSFLAGYPVHPDQPGIQNTTQWSLKATGSYDLPYGIRVSPVLRHQSGANYARAISVPGTAASAFGLVVPAMTIYATAATDFRVDNIWVLDTRVEKTVALGGRVRARLFLDGFNLTNSHASETITQTTGANFQRPAAILAPLTGRIGVRLLW